MEYRNGLASEFHCVQTEKGAYLMEAFWGILIPFLGTSLGAACVFFMKKSFRDVVQRALTGFAAGVMVAASVWSLLIPAIERSAAMEKFAFFPAVLGFWVGVLFLLALDHMIPHLHAKSGQPEGPKSRLQRTTMMILAVTLHNIPEGMAVGVVYAGYLSGDTQITAAGALALSLGIAIQNFPEGAIISMPLRAEGMHKRQSFSERSALRCGRTHRGGVDDFGSTADHSGASVSSEFCRRGYALCCGGGADPRDVSGQTFQYRHDMVCRWLQRNDDVGCRTWIISNSKKQEQP